MMDGHALLLEWFDSFRFVFTVQLAVWIFAHRGMPRARGYAVKSVAVAIAGALLAVAHIAVFTLPVPSGWPTMSRRAFVAAWVFVTFLLALAGVRWRREISWTNALSRWMLGICLERFVTAFVHNMLFLIVVPDFRALHPWSTIGIDLLAYGSCYALAAWLLAPLFDRDVMPEREESRSLCGLYAVSFMALSLTSSASMGVSEYDVPHIAAETGMTDSLDAVLWFSTAMAGVMAVVIFLFQYTIHHVVRLRHETAMLNLLNEQRARQYATLTGSMEFINHKVHDLKHQLAALEFATEDRRRGLVSEVGDALTVYDAAMRTGNDALDTMMTERNFFCARHGIRLSCMLTGCDWDAFDVVDLFTVFGNALDNAFDHVTRFDNPDKRVVSVSARQHGDLVVITFDNYCETPPRLRGDGLPATTKPDTASHGLGIRSIRMIARRYQGDIRIEAAPPVFTLRVSMSAARR